MKRIKPLALWLGALLVIAIALIIVESDLLWKIQQYDLFLFSTLFFKQQMVVSGGMLSYLGSFFTQFFYHPWLGILMLCSWWLLLMWLVKRAFCLPDRWNILALIPVAILLTANMTIGYGIYYMQLQGFFFVATIGTTAATALLWAFRELPEKLWLRIGFIMLTTLASYPLMGIYGLAATLLMRVDLATQQEPYTECHTCARSSTGCCSNAPVLLPLRLSSDKHHRHLSHCPSLLRP